uniref:TATA box-binding protein-associated factor RNA polymerase I subunit B n=1 Tax=Noccaea caerulescens TaxID=107243 RepID=A0A1J3FR22_NOCCA
MICNACESDKIEEEDDGRFYCQDCGVQAEGIIGTAVNDEDLIGEGGGTRGAVYQHTNARRLPSQLMDTPSQPIHTQETMRYSQFRSQLQSASQIPKFEPGASAPDVKQEPTEPADFGAGGAGVLTYEAYYKETRDRYVDGFLMMIMSQCDALVEKFNVTPLIVGLVGPICLRFVALSGVFDEDWADKSIHDSELQSQVLDVEDVKVEGREYKRRNREKNDSEPRNFEGKRAVLIWASQLRKSLPLSSSLAISFLVCHIVRAPVLPTDIVRWVEGGSIPYRSCFLKIQEKMGARSAACPVEARIMFSIDEIVSAQSLESRAASVADIIGLVLPPVDFYGIASNYLKRLSVPEDKVLDLVRRIQRWSTPSDLYLSKNKRRLPTRVCVMSILIVAIRMLYNINGFGVWERSLERGLVDDDCVSEAEADSPIHDEEIEISETKSVDDAELSDVTEATEYDTEELLKNLETKYHELAAETAGHKKDLLSFLSHGKNELFAGVEAASADDTYRNVDNLWNGYQKKQDEEFEQFGTPSKRGRDWEDYDLPVHRLSLNDDDNINLREGNSPCTSQARRSETESMDCDEPSMECVPSSPENRYQEEGTKKERAIRSLITDMADNFFVYIPPRVKVKRQGYLQYVRKKGDGVLVYSAHADYYVLLRVCARVAEIDARNLHRGVLSFERRLAWIDKRIDQVLHITPSIVKCKLCKDEDEDDGLVLAD